MKTAVDSSVLLAIFNGEPAGRRWLKCLVNARREGPMIVCYFVYAELAPAFASEADLQNALQKLGFFSKPPRRKPAGKRDTPSALTGPPVVPVSI